MRTIVFFPLLLSLLTACTTEPPRGSGLAEPEANIQSMQILRKYCRACHAVGPLKFITSTDDQEVLNFLMTSESPEGRLWLDELVDALDWPTEDPPPQAGERRPGKRWMPLGSKRLDIAATRIGSISAREALLEALRSHQEAAE